MMKLLWGLSVIFLTLQLLGVIDWPWYAVMTPVFCWAGMILVLAALAAKETDDE